MKQRLRNTCPGAVLVALVACGSDQSVVGAPGPAADEAPGAPLYAVSSCVDTADTSTGYALLVDSLDTREDTTLDGALEIAGCGVLSGPNAGGTLFVGEGESPIIRRYGVQGRSFVEQGALSLSGLGIGDAFYSQPHFVYLSETKAYILSGKGAPEIIVWNPLEMVILGTIPLEGLEREGVYPAFSYAPQRVGDRLYFAARWRSDDGFRRENALIVVDVTTDQVLASTTDERCADFLYAAAADDGSLYFSNGNYASAFRLALGEATAPPACILRVAPGELSFDPSFQVELSTLLDGHEGGGLVPGNDGEFFVQAFHGQVPRGTEWGDVFGIPDWRWWRLAPDLTRAELVDSLPPTAAAFDAFLVDGRLLSTLSAADYSQTTFIALDVPGGTPAEGRVVPGWVSGALRLR